MGTRKRWATIWPCSWNLLKATAQLLSKCVLCRVVQTELASAFPCSYQYCIEMLYACTTKFPHRNHLKEYGKTLA